MSDKKMHAGKNITIYEDKKETSLLFSGEDIVKGNILPSYTNKEFVKRLLFFFTNCEYSFLKNLEQNKGLNKKQEAALFQKTVSFMYEKSIQKEFPGLDGRYSMVNDTNNTELEIDVRKGALHNCRYNPMKILKEIYYDPNIEPYLYLTKEAKKFKLYQKILDENNKKVSLQDLAEFIHLPSLLYISKWLLGCKNGLFNFRKLKLAYPADTKVFLDLLEKYTGGEPDGIKINNHNQIVLEITMPNGKIETRELVNLELSIQIMIAVFTAKYIIQ